MRPHHPTQHEDKQLGIRGTGLGAQHCRRLRGNSPRDAKYWTDRRHRLHHWPTPSLFIVCCAPHQRGSPTHPGRPDLPPDASACSAIAGNRSRFHFLIASDRAGRHVGKGLQGVSPALGERSPTALPAEHEICSIRVGHHRARVHRLQSSHTDVEIATIDPTKDLRLWRIQIILSIRLA